uniref:YdcF family protein n=1 Tax=Methylobacterium sp. CCH5-D2 TaxID=1768765 RepID=UPI000A7B98DB
MFFPASKLGFFLFTPSNFLILCVLAGAALFGLGWRGTGGSLVVLAGIGLALGGLSPLPALAMLPLEERFPRFEDDGEPVTGIVVLGGGIETRIATARGQFVGNDADERQTYMAALARRYPQARLVFSGGGANLRAGVDSEADIISRYADTLGLPRSRLILEGRSRNTHETVSYTHL